MVCNITKECEIIVYFSILIVGIKVFLGTAKLVSSLCSSRKCRTFYIL